MGRRLLPTDSFPLRIVIGDAETEARSVDDVVAFLRRQEADDLADLLMATSPHAHPPSLKDVCARMEALCAMV